ncbi:7148_t:CDS:2 [Funneliformis geosporum]|nr:7148_t:CDS:2 [Funneliformis geosporum]
MNRYRSSVQTEIEEIFPPENTRLYTKYTKRSLFDILLKGNEIVSAFEVTCQAGTSVSNLRDIIYEKNKNYFKEIHVDANKLYLWKVDIPYNNPKLKTLESRSRDINEENTTIQELGGTKLTPFENIDDIFARNVSKNIRIIVQPPATTVSSMRIIPDEVKIEIKNKVIKAFPRVKTSSIEQLIDALALIWDVEVVDNSVTIEINPSLESYLINSIVLYLKKTQRSLIGVFVDNIITLNNISSIGNEFDAVFITAIIHKFGLNVREELNKWKNGQQFDLPSWITPTMKFVTTSNLSGNVPIVKYVNDKSYSSYAIQPDIYSGSDVVIYLADKNHNMVLLSASCTVSSKEFSYKEPKRLQIRLSSKNRKHIYVSVELPYRKGERSELFRLNEYDDLVIIVDDRNMEHVFGPDINRLMERISKSEESRRFDEFSVQIIF